MKFDVVIDGVATVVVETDCSTVGNCLDCRAGCMHDSPNQIFARISHAFTPYAPPGQ